MVEIALTTLKLGYFAQFGIFGIISGSKQSKINLLIYLLFCEKLQKQK